MNEAKLKRLKEAAERFGNADRVAAYPPGCEMWEGPLQLIQDASMLAFAYLDSVTKNTDPTGPVAQSSVDR